MSVREAPPDASAWEATAGRRKNETRLADNCASFVGAAPAPPEVDCTGTLAGARLTPALTKTRLVSRGGGGEGNRYGEGERQ